MDDTVAIEDGEWMSMGQALREFRQRRLLALKSHSVLRENASECVIRGRTQAVDTGAWVSPK